MIVLDTHIWIDLINERSPLSTAQQQAINRADVILVSTFSCWEIAMLVQRNRLSLDRSPTQWIAYAMKYRRIAFTHVTDDIALAAGSLSPGQFHGDPADRIIAMTARILNCPLLTNDAKIAQWGLVEVIA